MIIEPYALDDIDEGFRWYESHRPSFGDQFIIELRRVISLVVEYPEGFPIVHRATRRAALRRFPYAIYYRIIGGRIVVVACMHGRRNPRTWQER